ncbi:hypothetical protein AB0D32_16510 [Micromonospora sp. NPDC048170]|uniref:hypothetical protein n=1 Tax=Micromonospora sp. NPDC048170 TaxID=3154819 RepID=UPI0033D7D6B4
MRALRPMTEAEPEFEVNVKNTYVNCVDLSKGRTRQRLPLPDAAASTEPSGAHAERSPSRLPEAR